MKSCEWSTEEDRILFDRQTELGNRWTEIAKSLPGRTDNAVKNRFLALSKKVDQATHLASWSSDSATSRLSEGQALDEELKIQVPQAQQSTPKVPASTFLDVLDGRELQETFEIPLESVFPLDQQPSRRAEALNMVNDLPVDVLSFW